MAVKRVKLLLLIILIIFCFPGCWDSRDAEDKDIVISVAVDKTGEEYAFYTKIASISTDQKGGSQGGGESSGTSSRLLIGKGKSLIEARENLDRMSDNPIYLGAAQAVILTDRLADSGIEAYMLRLRQTPEYRKTLSIVVTAVDPRELLDFQPENSQSVGFAIESTIKSLVDTGQTFRFSLGDLLGIIASNNKCYLLHTIGIQTDLALTGYTVFDNDKRAGFIPIEDAKGVIFLKADQPKPYYDITFSAGDASMRLLSVNRDIKPIYKDGKVSFNVNLNIDAQVLSLNRNMKISGAARQEIAERLQKKILDDVSGAITASQGFGCDYLDFYTYFRIAYPEEVKSMDWKSEYRKAEFNVSVKAKIDLVSTANYSEWE